MSIICCATILTLQFVFGTTSLGKAWILSGKKRGKRSQKSWANLSTCLVVLRLPATSQDPRYSWLRCVSPRLLEDYCDPLPLRIARPEELPSWERA